MKGIYVLIIQIQQAICLNIGALGELAFPAGLCAYVGSAQNNLELRVARHKRRAKRLFWHIDYLLNNEAATIINAYYMKGDKTQECNVADLIFQSGGKPISGFGCSDCRCVSHLFEAEKFDFLQTRMQCLS